jgi:ParB-like chromosome segregation protein Spo0J
MKINCAYKKLVKVEELVKHPRNPNTHTPKQIELLAKILQATGFRSPIVISERSGFIVKGHGRLESAIQAGFETVPVDVQSYESEAEEYADMIADNRIAELSDMDSVALKDLIEELDTGSFDLDLTGYDETSLSMLMSQFNVENENSESEEVTLDDLETKHTCPKCGFEFDKATSSNE